MAGLGSSLFRPMLKNLLNNPVDIISYAAYDMLRLQWSPVTLLRSAHIFFCEKWIYDVTLEKIKCPDYTPIPVWNFSIQVWCSKNIQPLEKIEFPHPWCLRHLGIPHLCKMARKLRLEYNPSRFYTHVVLIGWKSVLRRHSVKIFQVNGNWDPENKPKFLKRICLNQRKYAAYRSNESWDQWHQKAYGRNSIF